MERVKEILKNLNVIDAIYQGFDSCGIAKTDDNLRQAGFGFHKITDSFDSTVVLTEEVGQLIDKMRLLQQATSFEQPFALLGGMQLDDENKPVIVFSKFVEDKNASKNRYSAHMTPEMLSEINEYLEAPISVSKVLLLGHTHPVVDAQKETIPGVKGAIVDALCNMEGNPLKLRNSGLNISVGDVSHLVQVQDGLGRGVLVLQGIVLQNGEFNVIFYDGSTIQSLDNVCEVKENHLVQRPNFRDDILPIEKKQ